MSDESRKKKLLAEANHYEELKDKLGLQYLENFRFLKSQMSEWYVALTAVCFAIGGISISVGIDKTVRSELVHPGLFWAGSLLLIANGIFIFLVRKTELESESSDFPNLKQTEADLWTARNIAREVAAGDNSRADVFADFRQRALNDYHKRIKLPDWWRWVIYVLHACMIDVAFGLLVFPILMLAAQLLSELHLSFMQYKWGMWILLLLYIIYTINGARKAVRDKKKMQRAEEQIRAEVER